MPMRKVKGRHVDYGPVSSKKGETMMPRIYDFSLKDLPEAKSWKVGQTYTITAKVKMTGIRQSKSDKDGQVDFEVVGVEVPKVKRNT